MDSAEIINVSGNGSVSEQTARSDELEAAKAHIEQIDACSACYANAVGALMRLGRQYDLGDMKICVGQGFKGKSGELGSGNCTLGFARCIKGCPPSIEAITDELLALRSNV